MKNPMEQVDAGTTMAEMWEGFITLVYPGLPATTVQYQEMQKSFYSGALCLFNWFMVQMDDDSEPTEGDLDKVSAINDEIIAFMAKSIIKQ